MAQLDPRTPVLVGAGQNLHRPGPGDDLAHVPEPVDLMVDALRRAGEDSGTADRLLTRADSIRVVEPMSWHYVNPALLIASAIGASPRELIKTTVGGNSPQAVVNDAAGAIARGELDVALIAGAEVVYSKRVARQADIKVAWATQGPDTPPPSRVIGTDRVGVTEVETAHQVMVPVQFYPIFENALRAAAGEAVEEHQVRISELWARFSEVAAGNPYAWSPQRRTAEEIRTPTADNRMIGFPYPKLMNSNIQTDQGAAVILCSVEAARAAGVPEDRWVFVHSGADAHDHWFVSERDDLHSSPAIAAIGRAVSRLAGVDIAGGVAHVDLYSCFPSAVQVGANALGLGIDEPDRPLTVTGGLCFAGGPGNNYVTHSIAAMAGVLRDDPGSFGLVTANGWYLTKHSAGLYSTQPPAEGFRWESVQEEVDAGPKRAYLDGHEGDVTVESYTVMHERDGTPNLGILACLLPDGRRTWANTTDADLLKSMTVDEWCGRPAQLGPGGAFSAAG